MGFLGRSPFAAHESSLLAGGLASAHMPVIMALKTSKHPVVKVFAAQASGIEEAVLTLLGEQKIEADEVTQTGLSAPDWGRLAKLDRNDATMAHTGKKVGAVATFRFASRRSDTELPWTALTEVAI